jgi:hypothetical protein
LTSRRDFFKLDAVWDRGQGRKLFSRWLFSPFSDVQSKDQPDREKKGVHHMNQSIRSKNFTTFILLAVALVCFGLAPMAQAVGPDTDGSIPGSNNGEGIGVLVSRTTGVWNTGTGFQALNHLTAGNQNTATGLRALSSDTNGGFNTATGVFSLFSNTSGFFNSATAAYSLAHNTDGNYNTANGYSALYFNTGGDRNTATGFAALYRNTTGEGNIANGYQALYHNTTGGGNTVTGNFALYNNTSGIRNTAAGVNALFSNTTGEGNTAIGSNALQNNTGDGNIALGNFAGESLTTGSDNIDIGNGGVAGESSTIRIGLFQNACFIAGIFNATTPGGTAVFVNAVGQLGTVSSSRRYKKEIKAMDKASEAILGLNPVTFHYKSDNAGTPQFGLIAEEVAEVSPDLVVRDADGEIYSVRYEAVNAMLLNEFLKAHRKAQQQEATIAQLKQDFRATVEELNARLKEQDSKIEKVSAQVEMSRSAPQMAVHDQ